MNFSQLTISELQCQKGSEMLFAPVSLVIKPGELAVVSGANGSGKTTLLETISGLGRHVAGQISFGEQHDPETWFEHSHFIGHQLGHKPNLTCQENIQFMANVHGVAMSESQTEEFMNLAGLAGYEYLMAGDLSAGQKKRLALMRLLFLNKPVWLLDEPFVNLDQSGCDWLYDLISNHVRQQGTVILTAHDQKKIHELADHHLALGRRQ